MNFQRKYSLEEVEELEAVQEPECTPIEVEISPERQEEIDRLILNHRENGRKLARSILRRWRVRMPAEEIDSIVDLSLCEAARRYSADRGASFMTFFFYHLRGHLVRSVARAAQASNVFLTFSRSVGISAADWSKISQETFWAYVPEYLVVSQRDLETPEHAMLRQEKIKQCQAACSKLDILEKEIIDRSFSSEQPLVDIAKSLGYSRCHISRVKKSALERLRNMLEVSDAEKTNETKERTIADRIQISRNSVHADRKSVSLRSRRRSIERARNLKRLVESKAA